jgi:hypothetical protein
MTYWTHAKSNALIAFKAALLCLFHLAHAVLPFRWTEHERYGIRLTKS